jgi:hypothetical protein
MERDCRNEFDKVRSRGVVWCSDGQPCNNFHGGVGEKVRLGITTNTRNGSFWMAQIS